ncbi:LexA family protein [Deinococcus cellulosilyticus]|uniref:Peptidase S24/S26A/S26B/S26C domain-containing protein n=1 Tax=Deinococcus cellulosilyticus (strain DSM 18568 / NBRC 106333 / KACC 11606 / 5516J-15) TaxID=1223518 RepID=A0A511N433_DEIC1|nr:S24 family peptidase [Deinococcus cellulosilyticus]GEM47176.1 hypothetical protein DC3_28110 [Deinococcus cellulosilyticus NBRC 106333 = KACC 11606]
MHKFSRSSIPFDSVIPLVSEYLYAVISAGEPIGELSLERVGWVKVRADYCKNEYLYIKVAGHSMDDGSDHAIKDGDIVVINTADRDARVGKIYMWEHPSVGPCLKKLDHIDGELMLTSLNPAHKPFVPEDGSRPLGRFVGVLQPAGWIEYR